MLLVCRATNNVPVQLNFDVPSACFFPAGLRAEIAAPHSTLCDAAVNRGELLVLRWCYLTLTWVWWGAKGVQEKGGVSYSWWARAYGEANEKRLHWTLGANTQWNQHVVGTRPYPNINMLTQNLSLLDPPFVRCSGWRTFFFVLPLCRSWHWILLGPGWSPQAIQWWWDNLHRQ